MNTKGQGALEYLLIIGGAIIVAGIVLTILMGASGPSKCSAQDQIANALCAKFTTNPTTNCTGGDPDGGSTTCAAGACQVSGSTCIAKAAWVSVTLPGRGQTCFPC
jgi:hypothetical protein